MPISSGAVQTEYTFEPFGKATATGGSSSNAFTFTGREDDGTGLLFYRARYYDPSRQRFLSEDPTGFGGGDANLYAYTFNSPTNFTDPTGEIVPAIAVPLAQCVKGAGFDVGTSRLEGMLGGRKRPRMSDLLKTALAGCLSDVFNPFDRLGDAARLAKEAADKIRRGPFNKHQDALIQLAKEALRKGLTQEQAETLLKWAREYDVKPALDHIDTDHWVGGPHIQIGPIDHIPVR